MRTPPSSGGVLIKNDSEDFPDHPVGREDIPPLRRLSNVAVTEFHYMWWRQVELGHRMPAEAGVTFIDGATP